MMICPCLLLALVLTSSLASDDAGLSRRDRVTNKLNELKDFHDITTVDQCDASIIGMWMGRTAINAVQHHYVWDRHIIQNDGSGILMQVDKNLLSNTANPDAYMTLIGRKPDHLWCNNANGQDKILKAQYGPTEYGLLVCIDLQMKRDGNLTVETNPALFTHPGLVIKTPEIYNCRDYAKQSFFDGFSVTVDRILDPATVTYRYDDGSRESSDFIIQRDYDRLLNLLQRALQKS